MALLTARSSTIFISTGDETHVYRSVEEVPPELRRKLKKTTAGINSATILIADKRGREELIRALQSESEQSQGELAGAIGAAESEPKQKRDWGLAWGSLRTWLELLLPVAIGASLWFFIESRF